MQVLKFMPAGQPAALLPRQGRFLPDATADNIRKCFSFLNRDDKIFFERAINQGDLGLVCDPSRQYEPGQIGLPGEFIHPDGTRAAVRVITTPPLDMWALPVAATTRCPRQANASSTVADVVARAPVQPRPTNQPSRTDLKQRKKGELVEFILTGKFPEASEEKSAAAVGDEREVPASMSSASAAGHDPGSGAHRAGRGSRGAGHGAKTAPRGHLIGPSSCAELGCDVRACLVSSILALIGDLKRVNALVLVLQLASHAEERRCLKTKKSITLFLRPRRAPACLVPLRALLLLPPVSHVLEARCPAAARGVVGAGKAVAAAGEAVRGGRGGRGSGRADRRGRSSPDSISDQSDAGEAGEQLVPC